MECPADGKKGGSTTQKYTGQSDVSQKVVCHEVIAEIMGMDTNNQGRNGREMKREEKMLCLLDTQRAKRTGGGQCRHSVSIAWQKLS